jgi:hypothetical protein
MSGLQGMNNGNDQFLIRKQSMNKEEDLSNKFQKSVTLDLKRDSSGKQFNDEQSAEKYGYKFCH